MAAVTHGDLPLSIHLEKCSRMAGTAGKQGSIPATSRVSSGINIFTLES